MAFTISSEQRQTLLWTALAVALTLLTMLLGPILMPFVIAAILAYVLNPWVDQLCRLRGGKLRLPRSLAALMVVILVMAATLALLLIIVPILQKQIPQLQTQIPLFFDKLDNGLSPMLHQLGIHIRLDSTGIKELLTEQLANSSDVIGKAVLASVRVGGTAVLGMLANLVLIPIVLFYLLVDWHALIGRIKHFIPQRWLQHTLDSFNEIDSMLAQYLRGQIMVMVALAAYYAIALSIAGFDLALPIGILTGLLVFIPYLGFGLGLTLALISAMLQFDGFSGLIYIGVIYGFGQMLESFVLTPRLVGERIGLHPLTVIFALMAFGQLFGFIGVLIALPASAILSVAVKHLRQSYLNSSFYRHP